MKTAYINGKVYTGELPLQEAFAVENGKFAYVGTNEAAVNKADEIVDLKGRFVCAGFNDSHMHLLNYGYALVMAPINEHTESLKDMIRCFKDYLSVNPKGIGGWILGRGWNQDYFADVNRMPNRWDLDKVSSDMPVCAVRCCGHALAVNSKALEILGVTAETPQVQGGEIVVENGQPNGVFLDSAMDMVYAAIPAPTKDEVKDMIRAACKKLNSYGVTSSQSDDYCVFRNLPWQTVNEAYRELERAGELSVRVYEQANFTNVESLSEFYLQGNKTGEGSEFFKIGPLKMLGDGALGAHTAYLSRPYADMPKTRGIPVFTQEIFDGMIVYANERDMQCAIHAIGDGCLDCVLSAFEKALTKNPRTNHRHGIVHCQITRPDQLEKIAKLGLHVYAQSIFLDYDIQIVESHVGKELADTSYSWKTLMKKGVTVSNGTDCPVELPFALGGIQCAVTRKQLKGGEAYLPAEAFSVQEALDSYTYFGAYASFEENVKGKIALGMLADFVILDKNPFEEDEMKLSKITVVGTFVGGKQVFGA